MKAKKFGNFVFFVGLFSAIISAALLVVSSFLAEEGLVFSGLDVLLKGVLAIFSFKFDEIGILLAFTMFCIAILCCLVWMIKMIVCKGNGHDVAKFILSVISIVIVATVITGVMIAKVTINDAEQNLYEVLSVLEGSKLSRLLVVLAIGFSHLALMTITIYAFINFALLKRDVEVVEENYDDRKAREEAFLKECEETGEYDVYEEREFDEPILSEYSEPVVEEVTIEESTEIHANFDPRKNRKVIIR